MKLIARLLLLLVLLVVHPAASEAFLRGGTPSGAAPPAHALTMPGSPAFLYSVLRYGPWSGNALRVKRSSDSTTLDIGFAANNYLDTTSLYSFCNATTCTVQIWYDESGNGLDTPTCTTNCPIIRSANTVFGIQPITFMPSTGNSGAAFLTIPSGFTANRQAYTFGMAQVVGGGLYNSAGFMGLGTDAASSGTLNNISVLQDNTATTGGVTYWQENGQYRSPQVTPRNIGTPQMGQASTFIMREDATTSRLRINGHEFTAAAQANVTLTGGYIGKTPWTQGSQSTMEGFVAFGYGSTLTATDSATIESEFNSDFGVTTAPTTQLVYDGDSITCGLNQSGYLLNLPRQTNPLLSKRVGSFDIAVAGTQMSLIYSGRANATARYNSGVTENINIIDGGTNDIENAVSGSIVGVGTTTFNSYLLPYIQAEQTAGYQKVVVGTLLPRNWSGSGTDFSQKENERVTLNGLITSNATTYGYLVVDYSALFPTPSTYYTGSTYSVDGTHPTVLTYGMMASTLAMVINPLIAANDNPTPNLYAENDNWPSIWQKTGTRW